jgi:hypothetical protein
MCPLLKAFETRGARPNYKGQKESIFTTYDHVSSPAAARTHRDVAIKLWHRDTGPTSRAEGAWLPVRGGRASTPISLRSASPFTESGIRLTVSASMT